VKRTRRTYTDEQLQFVARTFEGRCIKELARIFNARFGLSVTDKQMRYLVHRRRARAGYDAGFNTTSYAKRSLCPKTYMFVKKGKCGWRPKHLVLWEERRGKVPKGHFVIFADGDRRNVTMDNLLLVTRAEAVSLGRQDLASSDADLTKAGLALVRLRMAVRKRSGEAGRHTKSCSEMKKARGNA